MRRTLLLMVLLALCHGPALSNSATEFDRPLEQLVVQQKSLILNGYGVRERWWTEVYRCALYLPERSADILFIKSPTTAKAIHIRILYGNIPDRMPQDWREIFREELTAELMGKLRKAYKTLEDNDTLTFIYSPGQGTEIQVNNQRLLSDPGHDLMLELLDQWLGKKPVSKNLKRLLLNSAL